jgi:hypothetical protein
MENAQSRTSVIPAPGGSGGADRGLPAATDAPEAATAPVRADLHWEHGRLTAVETTCADVGRFLDLVRVRNPYSTWVSYASDLRVFFRIITKVPDQVTREDCVRFMVAQGEAKRAVTTISRRRSRTQLARRSSGCQRLPQRRCRRGTTAGAFHG